MTLIKAENRELTLSISINQRNPSRNHGPGTGLLLGTDFRHAVEFSRSGRARTPAFRPSFGGVFRVPPPAAMVKPRVCDPGRPASSGDARYSRLPSGCIPAAARLLSDRHPVQPTGRGVCPPSPAPVSRGAEKKLRAPGGGCQTGWG